MCSCEGGRRKGRPAGSGGTALGRVSAETDRVGGVSAETTGPGGQRDLRTVRTKAKTARAASTMSAARRRSPSLSRGLGGGPVGGESADMGPRCGGGEGAGDPLHSYSPRISAPIAPARPITSVWKCQGLDPDISLCPLSIEVRIADYDESGRSVGRVFPTPCPPAPDVHRGVDPGRLPGPSPDGRLATPTRHRGQRGESHCPGQWPSAQGSKSRTASAVVRQYRPSDRRSSALTKTSRRSSSSSSIWLWSWTRARRMSPNQLAGVHLR